MQVNPARQNGGSAIVNLIVLAIVAYGIFVGIQYAPQWIESRAVKTILDDMKRTQSTDPVGSVSDARAKVIKLLQVNEMNGMTESFEVSRTSGGFVITFSYERELNLLYETRAVHYQQSVNL
jgi:hypothetical protein